MDSRHLNTDTRHTRTYLCTTYTQRHSTQKHIKAGFHYPSWHYRDGPSTRLVETRALQHSTCWRVMETGHRIHKYTHAGSMAILPGESGKDEMGQWEKEKYGGKESTLFIAVLTCKALATNRPSYLHERLRPHKPPRTLRSSSRNLLSLPRSRTTFARRSFACVVPRVWNSLPGTITDNLNITVSTFKSIFN